MKERGGRDDRGRRRGEASGGKGENDGWIEGGEMERWA